jgi:cell wall-associated NlpC family hydrolase
LRPRIELFFLIAGVSSLHAQGRDVDFLYGRWYQGNQSTSYELRTATPLGGAFSHGLAGYVLLHDSLGRNRAFYGAGWELQAFRHRRTFGPYALAGVALGLSTDTSSQELAALWNLGAGLEWRPISWVGVGMEVRYRLQDVGPRGFWRASSDARDGVDAALTVSLGVGKQAWRSASGGGGGGGGGGSEGASQGRELPPLMVPATITGNAADVVRSALDVIGTPYVWGGTAANGFDCSGLVQWAYGQHGIRLPRMSRDQARSGSEITPVLEALHPGDVLLFAAQPGGGVTHVGMYVGELKFIHSSNDGVKLSRLESQDRDGAWWMVRWVGARRIVQ